jgi:hypothetical protein
LGDYGSHASWYLRGLVTYFPKMAGRKIHKKMYVLSFYRVNVIHIFN